MHGCSSRTFSACKLQQAGGVSLSSTARLFAAFIYLLAAWRLNTSAAAVREVSAAELQHQQQQQQL